MAKKPSFWSSTWINAWLKSFGQPRIQKQRKRYVVPRRFPFESLECRDMMAVVVTPDDTSYPANLDTIVIYGTGFDPIVSNDSVVLSDGEATVIDATETSLTLLFTTDPSTAGSLTVVVTSGGDESDPVEIATIVPVVTGSSETLAADATTIVIDGFGFDTTAANNTVTFANGAEGTVDEATATSLTVTITTPPTAAGSMTAVVTTNGESSGDPVEVAIVAPVITSSTDDLAADSDTIVINGFGFDSTPENNLVTFNDGAEGTVTDASATQITVTFSTLPANVGSLTAVVTSNGVGSGEAIQVANIIPVVTSNTDDLAADATSLIIEGFGFDAIASNNEVTFDNGAEGTVVAATATSLTVNLTTPPTTAGSLTALVTSGGVSTASAVQVATVIPVVTSSIATLAADATTLVIEGFGFDTTPENNTVVLTNGAAGTVTDATATSLTVTFDTNPDTAGSMTVVVTSNTKSSGAPVQVATVTPVVTSSEDDLAADETEIVIHGFAFDTTPENNTVTFNNGAVGTVTAATATQLTVTFDTKPVSAGDLTAVVTIDSLSSGTALQVATVTPVITTSTDPLAADATTVTINGFGFDPVAGNNTVTFDNGAEGNVTAATATSLTVTFTTKPTTAGTLSAVVTSNSIVSGTEVQVATVTPVVTGAVTGLAANATEVVISGFGFDPTAENNTVVLNNGAEGTVTDATATSLTVTFDTPPSAAGSLTAIVTSNSESSGSAIQVATITPVVTSSSDDLAADSDTIVITGVGFDPTPENNTVVFNNGAVGTVTDATTTSLTVTFDTGPQTAGDLTVIVTSNDVSSGEEIQVATVVPVVTSSIANLAADATTLIITGYGFDTIAGNNIVTLDDGAEGVVTAATSTSLTVTFSAEPTTAGILSASVTTASLSSGTPVQVATVTPVVYSTIENLVAANATTMTIIGVGFDTTPENNTIEFSDGAVGTVTDATATSLEVTFSTKPTTAGTLTAIVTSNGVESGFAVDVASVTPVVLANSGYQLLTNASTVNIFGVGFDTVPGNNSVVFSNGAVGTVLSATATALTVTLSVKPTAGSLTAVVTTNNVSNGSAVQVATAKTVVTNSTSPLAADATTMTINGFGFDTTATNNTVTFNNGAVGVVTAATKTALTVSFTTKPTTAGSLTAIVTSNGVASGTAVQVAAVTPVVANVTTNLAANATTVVITGLGFDSIPSRNTVVLNNGAVGTVTSASATSLTVTFSTRPRAAGSLTAIVTTNSNGSGSAVQIATVRPVVSANTSYQLGASANSLTISGFGFDTNPSNNSVTFNNGAVGTVASATATSLTVNLTTPPTGTGSLTAIVTSNSVSSGTAVQVATVSPVVTNSTASLSANATTMTIAGSGFDTTPGNNTVVFNNGAAGTVTAATATSLTVTFSTKPTNAGPLTAVVTSTGVSSGTAVQVATVIPTVTLATTNLGANATSIVIAGFGFSGTAGNNTVVLSNGAVGTVTSASATSLTVTLNTKPTTVGNLTAIVTSNSQGSGSAVQVATVVPVITSSTTGLAANANTMTISGFGFDTTPGNNVLVFNNGAVGTVTASTATSLTVNFGTKPTAAGSLTAALTIGDISSGSPTQVANVRPALTTSAADLAANATTVVINGFGFDTTPGNNTVVFNNGASGSVTSATATQITVTFSTKPTTAGSLTAVVTSNGVSSGTAVQVATVIPVVTNSTTALAANASTVTFAGFGFDSVAANNVVVFNNGAVGTVTSASATSLTVTFSTKPTAAGSLTASVTTKTISSGSLVQIASVTPVVVANSSYQIAANANTMTINGTGFDVIATNNTVAFNGGAIGTVTSATATALTVTFSTKPTTAGNLTAIVTTNGVSNASAVQVGKVIPVVSTVTTALAANAPTVTINGFGFDPIAGNNSVVFNNGATGNVTSATPTSLTVTFTAQPTGVGSLTAVVTTNTLTSGVGVQVATVTPVVTTSSASLAFHTGTLVINGFNFDTTASRNSVTFNNGAVGTVTNATATALTVTFSVRPTSVGSLTAFVTTNNVASGSAVQVANVVPVVTSSSAGVSGSASTITINGFGFDTTAVNNIVTFSNGAAGIVTSATANTLTVTYSTRPKAGTLTASVTTNGVNNGSSVQVATVSPTVTSSTANLAASATTLTINGFGFDTTAGNNTVVFNNGAAGSVTAATATTLTVNLTTKPTSLGSLTVVVTTNSITSGSAVQVATVTPGITASTASQALTSSTMTINGFGFDTTAANNTVVFNNGAVGTVSNATFTTLSISFTTRPTAGNLTAVVTTNGLSSGAAVQVATLAPIITSSTTALAANANSLTINGSGFDTTAGNNLVTFSNGAVGTVTAATATTLTVSLSTKPAAGSLTAIVTTNNVANGSAVQVATVSPMVTSSTASLALNGTRLVIQGFGFDPIASNNTVTLNGGALGTVTSATSTTLIINLTTRPAAVGNLTAIVRTNNLTSGSATQVATVVATSTAPTVTARTTSQAASAASFTIAGTGFSTTPANNTVVLSSGAIGTVTAATATSLTVTFSTKPIAGSLTAIVASNGVINGAAVQVATVSPVVTSSTSSLSAAATTLTINGCGFDPVASRNVVAFSNGAIGTVTAATATTLTVTLSTKPTTVGSMTATVTTNNIAGTATQVATVIPSVTSTTTPLAITGTTVVINGFGFSTTPGNNTVVFNNSAAGTVTAATATSLTVTLSAQPTTTGSLTAVVTTGGQSSGAAVQVANVGPAVTANTTSAAATASTITIAGVGFSTTAANNTVVFNNGAVGMVTNATATSLTVTFSTKPYAGNLTAVVTTNGLSSGTAVQVATVAPVVTSSTSSLAASASTITINGFGFDTTAANNTVTFNNGAAGTVTAASATSLTVTLSTPPTATGSLTATVTSNGATGSSVQVASIIPAVTTSTATVAANADTMTINGLAFDTTAGNNTVVFNLGAVGTVTNATATTLTVSFSTRPTSLGNLTAVVTTNSRSSGAAVQVGRVSPAVTLSTASLAQNASSIVINGAGFNTTAGQNTVTFNNGAAGTVTNATATALTVNITTPPTVAGNLTAVVTTSSISSGTAVQVATVAPVVTLSTSNLSASATTITIAGSGFDSTASRNTVTFNNGAAGTVSAATSTSLTVTITTPPTASGSLTATVTTNGASSSSVQVATVIPGVTLSTANLAYNASTMVINGFGFDTTPGNNTVVFNNGVTGNVTAASATQLTVTFGTRPTTLGSLTVVVTSGGRGSGAAVQVAKVVPVVTTSTTAVLASAATVVINGQGFSTTPGNNTVAFNNGAVGTVTAATATSLTVTLSVKPAAGNLTAVVTTNGNASGNAVQVATVRPVVTLRTTNLALSALSVVISGVGFDTTASHHTVVFNNGATGTVTAATATSLTVTFNVRPRAAGSLTAIVTSNGVNSGTAVQIATMA